MDVELQKLSKSLTGIAGEYYVAAELSLRGFMASITLRNNDSVDIHASKIEEKKVFAIQVKTNQSGKASWILTKKIESLKSESLFFIFVALKGPEQRPDFYIVPSIEIADKIKLEHRDWLATLGKNKHQRQDNDIRNFNDPEKKYFEKWDLLK